jgi:hypothetical protein
VGAAPIPTLAKVIDQAHKGIQRVRRPATGRGSKGPTSMRVTPPSATPV